MNIPKLVKIAPALIKVRCTDSARHRPVQWLTPAFFLWVSSVLQYVCKYEQNTTEVVWKIRKNKTFLFFFSLFFNFEKRPAERKIPARCAPMQLCINKNNRDRIHVGRLGEKRIIRVESRERCEIRTDCAAFLQNMTVRQQQQPKRIIIKKHNWYYSPFSLAFQTHSTEVSLADLSLLLWLFF